MCEITKHMHFMQAYIENPLICWIDLYLFKTEPLPEHAGDVVHMPTARRPDLESHCIEFTHHSSKTSYTLPCLLLNHHPQTPAMLDCATSLLLGIAVVLKLFARACFSVFLSTGAMGSSSIHDDKRADR